MKRDPTWADSTAASTVVRSLDSADAGEGLNITVWVEYEVEGRTYRLRERVRTRYVPTGRGLGGRGFKEQTVIGVRKGSELVVCFDPADPARAYLRDNVLTAEDRAYKRDVARRSLRVVLSIVLGFVVLACGALAFMFAAGGSTLVAAVLALVAVIILVIIVFALRKPGSERANRGTPHS